jgi:hypothetical protein
MRRPQRPDAPCFARFKIVESAGFREKEREFDPHRDNVEVQVQGIGSGHRTLSFGEKTLKIALVLSVDPDATAKHKLGVSNFAIVASRHPDIQSLPHCNFTQNCWVECPELRLLHCTHLAELRRDVSSPCSSRDLRRGLSLYKEEGDQARSATSST